MPQLITLQNSLKPSKRLILDEITDVMSEKTQRLEQLYAQVTLRFYLVNEQLFRSSDSVRCQYLTVDIQACPGCVTR